MAKDHELQQLESSLHKIYNLAQKAKEKTTGNLWLKIHTKNIEAATFYGQFYGFHVRVQDTDKDEVWLMFTFPD